MGRLGGARARGVLTAVTLVLLTAAAFLHRGLGVTDGGPTLTVTLAVAAAYLLSVGPRGAPLVWYGLAVDALVTTGEPLGAALLVTTGVQTVVTVGLVRVLELRFAHHGPVRRPRVMLEFALLGAAALPLAVAAVGAWLGGALGLELVEGSILRAGVAAGIGVLGVLPGLRMLVMGQVRLLDRTRLPVTSAVALISSLAVLAVVVLAGEDGTDSAQLLAVPVLALAMLAGTIPYSLASFATVLAVTVPVAITGTLSGLAISTAALASWWVVGVLGLLLAVDGDQRRAVAAEFESFFARSAAPSLAARMGDGTVLRANRAVAELLGRPLEEIVDASILDLCPGAPSARSQLVAMLQGEHEEMSAEFELQRPDGDERWVRCTAARVDLEGPQHDLLQVQFVDLTPEWERTSSLERTNETLESVGRRIAHDLKQPVTAVAAYASTLLEHGDRMDTEMVRSMYERLSAASRRAIQQLDDTFAAAARRDGQHTEVRLHELVADVVGVLDLSLGAAGTAVGTNLLRGRVVTDGASVRQILLNLLTNSIKYARDDEVPRIHVTSRVRGAGVELVVTDNGIGIPPDQLDDVFERGVRLAPERADGGGHGLADSRELAESLGGSLDVEPWPDGARLVLWLPDPSAADAQSPTRVLVVTGDERAAQVEQRLGRRSDVTLVGRVDDLDAAVTAAADGLPDVVLLDRTLAEHAEPAALAELAQAHMDARLVLLDDHGARAGDAAQALGAVRAVDLQMEDETLLAGVVGRAV